MLKNDADFSTMKFKENQQIMLMGTVTLDFVTVKMFIDVCMRRLK